MNTVLKNLETNFQILNEERNQKEIAVLEKPASPSQDYFNVIFRKYARVVCNGCGEIMLSYEIEDFYKNDGYCNNCNKS